MALRYRWEVRNNMPDRSLAELPVFGICGSRSSGKTTLIESLIPRFVADGVRVAVIKHDADGIDVDKPGKDTDRFFQAGATVFANDSTQSFLRRHLAASADVLDAAVRELAKDHDLILVEGHKQTQLPARIWLSGPSGDEAPVQTSPPLATFSLEVDRPPITYALVTSWLQKQAQSRVPVSE